jgi:hypothetical protein
MEPQAAGQQRQNPSPILPPHLIPHREILEVKLHNAMRAQRFVKGKNHPEWEIIYMGDLPPGREYAHLRAEVELTEDDIGNDPQKPKPELLLKAAAREKMRAYKRTSPTELLDNYELLATYYKEGEPTKNIKQGDTIPVFWRSTVKQVHVVADTPALLEPFYSEPGKANFLSLRAGHESDCGCVATVLNNNLPADLYVKVCTHRLAAQFYRSTLDSRDPIEVFTEGGHPSALNPTMVYFGKLSKAYTVLPVLTMRQSLAKLKRSKPVTYRPFFSNVNLEDKPEIVLGVFAQIQKSETFMRIKTLEEDAPELEPTADKRIAGGEYRFPAREIQFVCSELQDRHSSDHYTVDDLLNNSVFVAPFHGTLACTFCPSNMKPRSYRGLHDMILHIMKHHRNLLRSWFACPSCMKPHVLSYHQYIAHWEDQHAAVAGLIVRLDETNISSRLGWGLALLSVFQVCGLLKVANWHDPMETESESVITSIGGYALKNKMSPIQLRDAITRAHFAGIEDPDLKRRLYQKWQADRRRQETPAPATPSTSNGATYAAAVVETRLRKISVSSPVSSLSSGISAALVAAASGEDRERGPARLYYYK